MIGSPTRDLARSSALASPLAQVLGSHLSWGNTMLLRMLLIFVLIISIGPALSFAFEPGDNLVGWYFDGQGLSGVQKETPTKQLLPTFASNHLRLVFAGAGNSKRLFLEIVLLLHGI